MTDTLQSSETAINYGSGGSTVLQQLWVVPPAQTTSKELDDAITNRSESEASNLVGSSTSFRFEKSDILERYIEQYVTLDPVIISAALEAIESGVVRLFTGSADISSSVLDDFSTHPDTSTVKNEVDRLFSLAAFIDLEAGMTNSFSIGLEQIIIKHGDIALQQIRKLILNEESSILVAMEALKYIGNLDSPEWFDERRDLLEACLLKSSHAWLKDSAGLGLSFMDDPRSIPALELATERETNEELKEDLLQVLEQLKETRLESQWQWSG